MQLLQACQRLLHRLYWRCGSPEAESPEACQPLAVRLVQVPKCHAAAAGALQLLQCRWAALWQLAARLQQQQKQQLATHLMLGCLLQLWLLSSMAPLPQAWRRRMWLQPVWGWLRVQLQRAGCRLLRQALPCSPAAGVPMRASYHSDLLMLVAALLCAPGAPHSLPPACCSIRCVPS